MSMPRSSPPTEWAEWGDGAILHAGDDVYYTILGEGETAAAVWVWHWHTPTDHKPRWQASGCANHDLVQKEPLTLSPSLACIEGCPWHGYIENGVWRSV